MDGADKLASIRSGDEITFRHDDQLETGIVEGWLDRAINGRMQKCVTLKGSHLWVPVWAIVSRCRQGETTALVFEG